jgi:hypothetical protein
MSKLVIVVPQSRAYCGRTVFLNADGTQRLGPLRILATASLRVARAQGNPTCDPLHPFGHPPAGGYVVASSLPPGYMHPRRPRRFGNVGALLLAARAGEALASLANGRSVFALHGGPLDTANRLRPTRGGIRLSDADMSAVVRAMNAAQANGDPLEAVEVLNIPDADVSSVPALDLVGARQLLGTSSVQSGSQAGASKGWLLIPFALMSAKGTGQREVDRRQLLLSALALVGGLTATACSSQPSNCSPLACDPSDPTCPPDGYVCDDNGGYAAGGGVG